MGSVVSYNTRMCSKYSECFSEVIGLTDSLMYDRSSPHYSGYACNSSISGYLTKSPVRHHNALHSNYYTFLINKN